MHYLGALLLALLLGFSIYPLQYVFDYLGNYLAIQIFVMSAVMVVLLKFRHDKAVAGFVYLVGFYFIVAVLTNDFNLSALYTNAIPLNIAVMLLVLMSRSNYGKKLNLLRMAVELIFIAFTVYSVFLNVQHDLTQMGERTKGFGSGTLYATISVLVVIYWFRRYADQQISLAWLILLCAPMVWSIFLTQSRGAFLVLLLSFLWMLRTRRLFILLGLIATVLLGSALIWPEIFEFGVLSRLNINNYIGVEDFSSGRVVTQIFIVDAVLNASSWSDVIFGHGMNSLKHVIDLYDLEFPHFDALYILHDGGLFSLVIYFVLAIIVVKRSNFSVYFLIFFLSGMHTNMILAPTILIFIHFLDLMEAGNGSKFEKLSAPIAHA